MKRQKYKIIFYNVKRTLLFCYSFKNLFSFKFLPHGLYCEPEQLRVEVKNAIDETNDSSNVILLRYDLCNKVDLR